MRSSSRLTDQTRGVIQQMLQRHTNDKTSSPIADFGCPLCHAKYAVTRRPTSPGIIPVCEECDQEFMSQDDGDWLLYDRADA
jgi:hypothetical protein